MGEGPEGGPSLAIKLRLVDYKRGHFFAQGHLIYRVTLLSGGQVVAESTVDQVFPANLRTKDVNDNALKCAVDAVEEFIEPFDQLLLALA